MRRGPHGRSLRRRQPPLSSIEHHHDGPQHGLESNLGFQRLLDIIKCPLELISGAERQLGVTANDSEIVATECVHR